jgi:hypothetical protein
MKEISVSSAIVKLHSIIVSFFLFILIFLTVTFILLINGIHIDSLKLSHLKVEQLYIKWDEKLTIKAKSIDITTDQKRKNEKTNKKQLKEFFDLLRNIREFSDLVKEVNIERVRINNYFLTYKFKEGEDGYLTLHSNKIEMLAALNDEKKHFKVDIKKLKIFDQNTTISGIVLFNNKQEIITSKLQLDIMNDANLTAYIYMDTRYVYYALTSHNTIHNLPFIIKSLKLPDYIHKWVYDAVQLKDADLNFLYGNIDINNPNELIKTINADANLSDVSYTFDSRVAPVSATNVHLTFQNAILGIHLRDGLFHNQHLQNSYLDIDLDPKKYLLHLYLHDQLSLDSDVLNLLKTYEIILPFMQTSATIDTKLDLNIKLDGFDTDANGSFAIDHGSFLYKDMNLDASNGFITIKGSRVDVHALKLSYKDLVDTNVSGYLIPNDKKGHLDIDINGLNFSGISLSQKQAKLHVAYDVQEHEDLISVSPSVLNFKESELDLKAFNIKFDLQSLFAKISPCQFSIPNKLVGTVSGDVNLDDLVSNLDIKLSKLEYKNIKLTQNQLDLSLKYNNFLKLQIDSKTQWKLNDNLITLSPLSLSYNQQKLKIDSARLDFSDTFSTNFALDYDTNQSIGMLTLQNVLVHNKLLSNFFDKKEKYRLKIDNQTQDTQLLFDQYNTKLILQNNGLWALRCQDFSKIYKNIPLFSDLNITNGNFTISSSNKNEEYYFSGSIKSPYKVLVKENIPSDLYTFNGKYTPDETNFTINNDLNVNINKDIKLTSNNVGYNIPEIVKFINEHPYKSDNNNSTNIALNAKNSYLYFKNNRKMMADMLNVQYGNSGLTSQIRYSKGNANFSLNQFGIFYLNGSNFNDMFMEKLFTTSKFSKGALSFTFSGTFDDFAGVIEIHDTILKEYGALNNLFAFINTVPSLITFRVPGFSQSGLHVKNMYVGFTSKKGVYDLNDISLISKEIKILGKGTMDMNNETLNLDLNLKSDLASQASKIPLVGYILFDKDSISTSLKVDGSIYDPEVSTSVAKDIIIAPLNIIKRTLLLPVEIFSPSSK